MRVCGCDCAHARLSTCVCICACDALFLSVVKGKTVQTSEGKVLDNLQGSEQRVEKTDPVVDGCTVVGVMTTSSLEGILPRCEGVTVSGSTPTAPVPLVLSIKAG